MNRHPDRSSLPQCTGENRAGWFRGAEYPCDPNLAPSRPFRLILLGPPGVGKGTQASRLCQQLRACHLSTGDLFRAAKCDEHPSPAMRAALDAMKRGELVSDELVIDMVRERAGCLRCAGGFLLDGFPRTLPQAHALAALLDELQVSLDAVIAYEMPIEEIVSRLGGRRTCSSCQAVYHVVSNPPRAAGICDQCGGTLFQRDDDRPEAIRVRMRTYEEDTRPLIDYYAEQGTLARVSASGSPDEVLQRSLRILADQVAVLE